ncbi:MAG: mechanosensitive ion channel family protein [Candidatus Onthomonas sp.]
MPLTKTLETAALPEVQETLANLVGDQPVRTLEDFLNMPLVHGILTLLVCLLLAKVILTITDRAVSKIKVEQTMHKFFRSVLRVVVYTIVILVAADSFGFNVSSLVALVSVCGAAFALAAQNTLANFFGGILLLITKPFLVGDYVSVASGEGTVVEIGLLNTRFRTVDSRIVVVPNDTIFSGTIVNFSQTGLRRIDLSFSISYENDIDLVRSVMLDVLKTNSMVLTEPEPPFARITAYGESSVTYTARFWCKISDFWPVQYDLLEDMKKAFDARGIVIPYNHLNVHMVKD